MLTIFPRARAGEFVAAGGVDRGRGAGGAGGASAVVHAVRRPVVRVPAVAEGGRGAGDFAAVGIHGGDRGAIAARVCGGGGGGAGALGGATRSAAGPVAETGGGNTRRSAGGGTGVGPRTRDGNGSGEGGHPGGARSGVTILWIHQI